MLQNTCVADADINFVFSITYFILNYIYSLTVNDPVNPLIDSV